jgi:hypothetical protein
MEAKYTSETSVLLAKATERHIPVDNILNRLHILMQMVVQ